MFPNTKRDEFHRRPFEFDAGRSPAVDEELLQRPPEPVVVGEELADPLEVTGQAGGPDPFEPRRREEQVCLCDPTTGQADLEFL